MSLTDPTAAKPATLDPRWHGLDPAADELADLLLAIEDADCRAFRVLPLYIVGEGAFVTVRFPGVFRRITPAQAVDVSTCLREDPPFPGADALADTFLTAAVEAGELARLCVGCIIDAVDAELAAEAAREPGSPEHDSALIARLMAWTTGLGTIAAVLGAVAFAMFAG